MRTCDLHHATAVAKGGRAVLIRGPSGCGKSTLALALLHQGWMLVGDDYVTLDVHEDHLVVRPAEKLRGWMEVRGQGLLPQPYLAAARVAVVADLGETPERLASQQRITLYGIAVYHVCLRAHSSCLVAQVCQALINS
jgi:serine kinase of HPr protein (carbohydrate metabolism regulator)